MFADSHVVELLPAYVLSSLNEDERLLVSEHLSVCSVCAAELSAYQALADQLALAAPDAIPSPDLKGRLLARLPSSRATLAGHPRQPGWRPWPNFARRVAPAWGVVSFLFILVLAVSNFLLWQRVVQLEAIRSSGMRAIPLTSIGSHAPDGAGFVIIGADGQNGAFVVDALPPLDAERQYQLWLIQSGQSTSGAVFSVDEYGYGGGRIRAPKNLFEYSGCDVSIEPVGGSEWPTGEKVLAGPLR
ncbi:MAG: anti-sigma factor [Chloroflexi bacterium]|nr:anti-sigma factor [Chloroflexota bacterium]